MTKQIRKFNHRDIQDRELFLISVDDLSDIFPLPERENSNFALLLLMDGRKESVGDLGFIPQQLIKDGLAYLCAWGEDCSRIHDIFDEVAVQMEIESKKEIPLMTTSHNGETIDEALWFFLFNAIPDEVYLDACKTACVISVGSTEWSKKLENGISDIDGLVARVVV